MSQVLKIKELMEKYKDENPLVTLRSCVAKCHNEMNNCMKLYRTSDNFDESELTFWVELYDYFAEKTSNFAIYLDQFRVWQKYDENIRYCYIKDFADNYNLQISDESNKVYMRFDSDKHTLEDAIKLFKSNDGYNKD